MLHHEAAIGNVLMKSLGRALSCADSFYTSVCLGISIYYLSESFDDTATCTDNSTASPPVNLIH